MNPKYIFIILGMLLILTAPASATYHQYAVALTTGSTLYVGGTGPGNYSKIIHPTHTE